ncbi:NERD domain-containing protein [Undibacterium sp. LX40W]|uniref:NERD domain-containing protein n=1 Tax=Undibacterium nitidum TaxID=2762298 RepID=A0A923HQB6_9BURK|nr:MULTISPECIES: nuclease-related domain-containing protein [Undibacterium]MBC3881315.1 NERD domain-containing protein [Undibacterium nitidum]MBC3891902.1 NERD domain-containing protein [Undibacterium sp. LX40W]
MNLLIDALAYIFINTIKLSFKFSVFFARSVAQLMFFPVKAMLTKNLDLFGLSWHVHSSAFLSKNLSLFINFLSIVLIYVLVEAVLNFQQKPILILPCVIGALISGQIIAILLWLGEYADDAEVQKRNSGKQAEDLVDRIISINQNTFGRSKLLKNCLFVFNRGEESEFSVETDHLLITQKNIFLIETKRKSGEIYVDQNSNEWSIWTPNGETKMRNALRQVLNSKRALESQLKLPVTITPIVVFVGDDTKIMSGPSNVVTSNELIQVITAFEKQKTVYEVEILEIAELMGRCISSDPSDFALHVKRAQDAQSRFMNKEIVRSAKL